MFESRPGFPVTANVYVPRGHDGERLPVIVNPHGHWAHKKSEPVVQMRAISQALHGYLAIVVDSPGYSFEANTPIERRSAGPHDDFKLLLASANATGFYVWDLIRLLDYLETRPDADLTKVGITGTSGGGLATVYAFAAEPRFTCAVPVCYPTSLEVNPNNGCLCNHVAATLQIGDRSDILAIRAPAPVWLIGATDDAEFPPEGTKRTAEKMAPIWVLLGAGGNVGFTLVQSGHDYNRPMREAAMGFFDRHLRATGDGSPVAEPKINPEPADSMDLWCLPADAKGRTMRELAAERLLAAPGASLEEWVALNGGVPDAPPLRWQSTPVGPARPGRSIVTFDSEKGLTIPGILDAPSGPARAALVLVSDGGKLASGEVVLADALVKAGIACLRIDARGTGELGPLDLRFMAYLGTGVPFAMGIDALRAAQGLLANYPKVGVLGRGPAGSQAALAAALLDPKIGFVGSFAGPRDWIDAFDPKFPDAAIQPRADLAPSLAEMRAWVARPSMFTFGTEAVPDVLPELDRWLADK